MLIVLAALSLGLAAFLVAEAVTVPARRRREALKRVAAYGAVAAEPLGARRQPRRGRFDGLWAAVASGVLAVLPRTSREDVERRLIAAGVAGRLTADKFLAAKGIVPVAGILFGVLIASKSLAVGIILIFVFLYLGFLGPDVLLSSRTRQRHDAIQASLPDALDLLAVSVEAGLGFEAAVTKLVDYMSGPLIEEFSMMLAEIRIGESRADALKRMGARIDVPEVTNFVRAVVQAEQLGASMAAILRTQAADARVRRQLVAEEKAMKLPIKMLIPVAIFILPATFIVVLGAALLSLGNIGT